MYILYKFVWSLQLLSRLKEFVLTLANEFANLTLHQTHVANSLYNITRTRLTLCTNHRCTLSNTTQCLAQVACTAYEWYFKLCLINMVDIISWRKNLALIDVINLYCLQNLRLRDMTDTALCHHRDGHSLLNAFDHLRVAHT